MRGKFSEISIPGTLVLIGLYGPRISTGALGFMSQVASLDGPPTRNSLPRLLEQMEVHFDGCRRHHRLSVAGARTEAPLLHRLDGLLLKPESKPPRNPDVPQPAVGVHLAIEHHHALQPGFARFFGEFRLHLEKHHGSG